VFLWRPAHYNLIQVCADAAILYRYVDEADLEATELLELIDKSPILENDGNLSELLTPELERIFYRVLEAYRGGTLNLDDPETENQLLKIKKNIKVLRFSLEFSTGVDFLSATLPISREKLVLLVL
jgi:hypothetical protein